MKPLLPILLVSSTVATAATAGNTQPNIVILFADDLGWADLGYQNPKFDTPNINQLKSDGLYLAHTYVSTATSSPSRASLLTGKEALRCGFVRHIYDTEHVSTEEFQTFDKDPGNMKSRAWLPLKEITYAERLREFGYYNMFIGKWHLGHDAFFPTLQGFDAMYGTCAAGHPSNYYSPFFRTDNPLSEVGEGQYMTDVLTDGAVEFVEEYDRDQPFLLNVWYYGVHSPHIGRKDLVAKYEARGLTDKDAIYAAMVEAIDESIGRIRESINDKGLADNTIFIFTSDQGGFFSNAPLSGGKIGGNTLGEGGSRVPMIIYAPNMDGMGQTYDRAVQTLDIYPTLVELASGNKCRDKQIQGVSLLPVMQGGVIGNRDLFLHRSYEDQNSAIINGDWKLIKYRSGKLELFNLKDDLSESTNLAEIHPQLRDKMLKRLNKWQNEATPQELLN